MRALSTRLAGALVAVALAAGCDFTPAIDIETPAFEPAVVIRSVLSAGEPALVRLSLSGDPLAAPVAPADRLPSATPAGARVTLLRDGRVVETLAPRAQTCYVSQRGACNAATGRVDVERTGAYDCSAFGGSVPVEAGATYTVRAEIPGLPAAEATVTIPQPAAVTVTDEPGGSARRFRVRVRDVPGADTRYTLAFYREYGAYRTQVCRRGGPRDTTVVLSPSFPFHFQANFKTSEPVLLATATPPATTLFLAPFTDATFDGREGSFLIEADPSVPGHVVLSGGIQVQVSTLSPTLYDAHLASRTVFSNDDPFAEPAELPGNVGGGFGLVGAAARVKVTLR